MPETNKPDLGGISETLLLTLYLRAMESRRPDGLIRDERAELLVDKISCAGLYDFNRLQSLPLSEANKLVLILRSKHFDRLARDFLVRYPHAVVAHIGCGLDARFERLDNGQVQWYDLDLPQAIELRRTLVGDEGGRYHLLGCSVLDEACLEAVAVRGDQPVFFLAEGVFMYFTGAQVKSLVFRLRERFPGAELVFDAYSPLHVLKHNLQRAGSKIDVHVNWGIWHGQEVEKWAIAHPSAAGIRLLDEWCYFDDPTPRLDYMRWARPVEALARTFRIYHFRLGEYAGSDR